MISFFLPTEGPKKFIYVDFLGASIPVQMGEEPAIVPKGLAALLGQSTVSAKWDCSCTWWVPPPCSGICNVYYDGTLFPDDSYDASCDESGISQDGFHCLGCCFRIDCTKVKPPTKPPTIQTTAVCSTPGNAGWCRGGASLKIAAKEPQGDPMTVTCTNPTVSANGSTSVGLPEGTGTAMCTVTSGAGSDSDSAAWKVDTVPPTNSPSEAGNSGSGGWYIGDVNVSVSGTDNTSGVREAKVRIGGNWYQNSGIVSANGSNAVLFRVVDNAGNINDITRTIKIDKIPPSFSPSISGTMGAGGWYITNPTIYIGGSDAHSGVNTQRVEVSSLGWQNSGYTLQSNGTFSLNYEVTDNAGHSSTGVGSVKVDATEPSLSVNIQGGGGLNGWHTAPLSVSVSGADAVSGLKVVEMQVDGGGWGPGPFTFHTDGVYSLEARAIDNAGNVNLYAESIQVDMTRPDLSYALDGTMGSNGWYISTVEASIYGNDSMSGIGAERIRINGGAWEDSITAISTEGSYNIEFQISDLAGNSASASDAVKIDLYPPVINNSVKGSNEGGYYGSTVTISVGAVDSSSGIASEKIRIDGGAWIPPGTFTLEDGSHLIEYKATDYAGYTSTKSETIAVDANPPSAVTSMPKGCSGMLTFSGIARDTSGVASAEIIIDGNSTLLTLNKSGNWSYETTLSNGNHKVVLKVTDNAGNSISETHKIAVDNTPPNIVLDKSWETWTYGNLLIKDKSGFRVTLTGIGPGYRGSISYSSADYPKHIFWRDIFPSGVWGSSGDLVKLNVAAKDVCGNVSTKSAQIFVPFPLAPTIVPTQALAETTLPTQVTIQKSPEPPSQAKVQPTSVIEIVEEQVGKVVEVGESRIEVFRFPLWLWGLLSAAGIGGFGGAFWDPRPREIDRLSNLKEERIDLFVDTYDA